MRKLAAAVLLAAIASGCATLRAPLPDDGPHLTISNEAFGPLELAYRCSENGPVRRLGAIQPRSSQTFVLRPAFCSTAYLIRQPLGGIQPLGIDLVGERHFAVVPFFGKRTAEIVWAAPGVIVRRDTEAAEAAEEAEEAAPPIEQ
jgi:hypothetical protein